MRLTLLLLLFTAPAMAAVTLPYTFAPGQQIKSSEVNANFGAVRDGINSHTQSSHTLSTILQAGNSTGNTPINFNYTQAQSFRVENVAVDPVCIGGTLGRLVWNATEGMFKVCNGSTFITIAGLNVPNLTSILANGNSAGTNNIDVNFNELLNSRAENLAVEPAPGNVGRVFFDTVEGKLKVDTGVAIQPIGGAQGLSSVLGVSNSTGSSNIDFNNNQALNLVLEKLGVAPAPATAGRVYYNTASGQLQYDTGAAIKTLVESGAIANADISGSAAIDWSKINKAGSSVADLASHSHTSLTDIGTNTHSQIDTHIAGSSAHGTTSNVVGISDTQTLTNKTISGASNTLSNIPNSATTATSANTNSAIVARDGSGNFSAGTISANLTGNVTGNISGSTGSFSSNVTSASLTINGAADVIHAAVRRQAGQTADIMQWQTEGNAKLAGVDKDGKISAPEFIGPVTGNVTGNVSGTAANVTGTVAIANGGTGQTSASAALNALLPTQTGNANKVLATDGVLASWVNANGGSGGGSPIWIEDAYAPISAVESGIQVYKFQLGAAQYLTTLIEVPRTYQPGKPVRIYLPFYCPDSSGYAGLSVVVTRLRPGLSSYSDSGPNYTSGAFIREMDVTNQNKLLVANLNLTGSSGEIDFGSATEAGDLFKVVLSRTGTAASDIRFIPYGSEVTFQ